MIDFLESKFVYCVNGVIGIVGVDCMSVRVLVNDNIYEIIVIV